MKGKATSCPRTSIEMLESRQLLSAAPISTPAAVHTHPTPTHIVGIYPGNYTASNATSNVLDITIVSESKTGKISGSIIIATSVTDIIINITGSVSTKGKFAFHGSASHQTVRASGSASSDATTLIGKFSFTQKHGSYHATFSAGLAT